MIGPLYFKGTTGIPVEVNNPLQEAVSAITLTQKFEIACKMSAVLRSVVIVLMGRGYNEDVCKLSTAQ